MIKQNQNSQVGLSSAGNYSCSTHQSNTATVTIIVVQGEQPFGKHKRKRHTFWKGVNSGLLSAENTEKVRIYVQDKSTEIL